MLNEDPRVWFRREPNGGLETETKKYLRRKICLAAQRAPGVTFFVAVRLDRIFRKQFIFLLIFGIIK